MADKGYLALLSLQSFDLAEHKNKFIKTFIILSRKSFVKPMSQELCINVATIIYEAFCNDKTSSLEKAIIRIEKHLKQTATIEKFLSNLFLIFLGDYSKAMVASKYRFKSIKIMVAAIDNFIETTCKLYSGSTVSVGASPDDIAIDKLEQLRQDKIPLHALNTYNGVPIEFPVTIIHTHMHKVILGVHPLQQTAATFQKGIYLLSEKLLGYDLYAYVEPAILDGKDCLELTRFDKLSGGLHKRQTIRVRPEMKTTTRINNHKAVLYDISIGGIATLSAQNLYLSDEKPITLELSDAYLGIHGKFSAILINTSAFERGYKYHLKLNLSPAEESEISRYIMERQQKIITDLKEKAV